MSVADNVRRLLELKDAEIGTLRSELDSMMGSNESLRIDNEVLRSELAAAREQNKTLSTRLIRYASELEQTEANLAEKDKHIKELEGQLKAERIAGMEAAANFREKIISVCCKSVPQCPDCDTYNEALNDYENLIRQAIKEMGGSDEK